MRAATNTGFTSPSCATSSGFLNLLTCYSALTLPALFHAGTALGFSTFRGFPPASAANTSRCRHPLVSFLRITAGILAWNHPKALQPTTPWSQQPPPSAETLELGRQLTIRSSWCKNTPLYESDALDQIPKHSAVTATCHRIESANDALPPLAPSTSSSTRPEGLRLRRARMFDLLELPLQATTGTTDRGSIQIGLQGFEQPRDPYPTRAVLPALAGRSSPGLCPLQGILLASLDAVSPQHLLS